MYKYLIVAHGTESGIMTCAFATVEEMETEVVNLLTGWDEENKSWEADYTVGDDVFGFYHITGDPRNFDNFYTLELDGKWA